MIPAPLPSEARCAFTPHYGRRIGPSVFSPSYQLAMNAPDHLYAAHVDVATWAERIHRGSVMYAAAMATLATEAAGHA